MSEQHMTKNHNNLLDTCVFFMLVPWVWELLLMISSLHTLFTALYTPPSITSKDRMILAWATGSVLWCLNPPLSMGMRW